MAANCPCSQTREAREHSGERGPGHVCGQLRLMYPETAMPRASASENARQIQSSQVVGPMFSMQGRRPDAENCSHSVMFATHGEGGMKDSISITPSTSTLL